MENACRLLPSISNDPHHAAADRVAPAASHRETEFPSGTSFEN